MKALIQKLGVSAAMLLTFLSASAYDFEVDGIYYTVTSFTDFTCEVSAGNKKYAGDIIIPAEVTYINRTVSVTSIGQKAFDECDSLTSIALPNSIAYIGERAFNRCSSLASIEIPNSVTSIENGAFYYCDSLTSIALPNSIAYIGERAFSGCISLASIEIPNSVTFIGDETFYECFSLTSIEIPNSITSIGKHAISSCTSLTSIEIPNSVTYIGGMAFDCCESLNTLILEYSDKELSIRWANGNNEFEYVTFDRAIDCDMTLPKLKELILGEHIEKVQVADISSCDKLEAIECRSLTPPSVKEFSNAQYMNLEVQVPEEAIDAYKRHRVWGNFWNLAGGTISAESNVAISLVQREEIGRYDLYGRSVSEDYQGMVIIRYSDGSTSKVFAKK